MAKVMCTIIGRKQEIEALNNYRKSGRAEFVAVYGRRRVGKTFLVNEVLGDYMAFRHTGLSPYDRKRKTSLKDQLQNFYYSLIRWHGRHRKTKILDGSFLHAGAIVGKER